MREGGGIGRGRTVTCGLRGWCCGCEGGMGGYGEEEGEEGRGKGWEAHCVRGEKRTW